MITYGIVDYMKKSLVAIILILPLLTGCFGGGDDGNGEDAMQEIPGYTIYDSSEFSLQVPDEWEVLTPVNFKSDTPANTLVAFRSNVRNPKFTANVAIVRNELAAEISTYDYARGLYQKVSDDLMEFKSLALGENKIYVSGIERDSLFIYIEGRTSADADIKRFMQISGVNGKNAYIITGSFLPGENEDTINKVEKMVKSFKIK